jgi:3-oxoacyl-[acyl-carrier protein] reductase
MMADGGNMRFQGKNVLVSGSSRGIGAVLVRAFACEGANVGINYRISESEAKKLHDELAAGGRSSILLKADVTVESDVRSMVAKFEARFGAIDILVNNAGYYEDSTVWKMDEEKWDRVIDVNLKGAFLCTKHALPNMRKKGFGRIVSISSVVGQVGVFGTSNYSAAKAGLFGFTKAVAREVVKSGVTVNCLTLGYFDAGMLQRLPPDVQKVILAQIPLGRWGRMDEIVEPVFFLCTPGAGYITGQVIHDNGGYYM